jgi:hypothetical protein
VTRYVVFLHFQEFIYDNNEFGFAVCDLTFVSESIYLVAMRFLRSKFRGFVSHVDQPAR